MVELCDGLGSEELFGCDVEAVGVALDRLIGGAARSAARTRAAAGAGKTTAMRALTLAWTEDGGQVLGLAPSAAAPAVLGELQGAVNVLDVAEDAAGADRGEC